MHLRCLLFHEDLLAVMECFRNPVLSEQRPWSARLSCMNTGGRLIMGIYKRQYVGDLPYLQVRVVAPHISYYHPKP